MNKKIISILVCMLFIVTVIPIVTSVKNSAITKVDLTPPLTSRVEDWIEIQKLLASDGAAMDHFGRFVSLDGDTALIGVECDDDNGENFGNSGSAYIFIRSGTTWTQQAKLLASDGGGGDYFGSSVSLDGDTALIGAKYNNDNGTNSGSAYVFTRSGTNWTQQAKLLASDGGGGDYFGSSVSLDGDTALIGAERDDDNETDSGSAYVFTCSGTNWTQQVKLTASDGEGGDHFGFSVSLDADTIAIGAVGDNSYNGSVCVFTRSGATWSQQAKLLGSDSASGDYFGWSVSLDGDTALVGAACDDDYGTSSGSAYVFTRSGTTWTQQAKLHVSDGVPYGWFGYCASLDGDTALIGAVCDDDNGTSSGSVYLFTRSGATWVQHAKLTASDGAGYGWFGCSVSLDGDTALIGAYGDDAERGSAYVFIREGVNLPPDTPIITGPATGKIKVTTNYNFSTIEPDADDVSYYIEWGDGTNSGWIGPYTSEDVITQSHNWTKKGDYMIKAKAKDINGAESDWGTFSVTMPYEPPHFHFIQWLFERFPNAFPILRQLLAY
jgi:hypothetical protein